ncbi:hypothetical protein EDC04DRAFT_2746425, partial [Pisolithus marmoratus]
MDPTSRPHYSTRNPSIMPLVRRFTDLAAIKALKHLCPRYEHVLFLTDKLCVKYGPLKPLSGVSTLRLRGEAHAHSSAEGMLYIND